MLEFINSVTGVTDFLAEAVSADFWLSASSMARALVALWLVVCVLAASARLVHWALPGVGVPLRLSSILAAGTWLATAGFHLLRTLGCFSIAGALIASGVVMFAALRFERERAPLSAVLTNDWKALRRVARLLRRGPYNLPTIVLGAFVALLLLRSLLVPPLGWDSLTYHGPRAAQWVQSGKFTFDPGPGSFGMYRLFFGGGELLEAWAMLPFHSDLLLNLGNGVQWLAVGLASWALARALGLSEPFASTSAAVVLLCPTLQVEMGSGYIEAPLNAALLHGMAITVHCLRRPSGRAALLGAMSLGVALGIKLTAAPAGLVCAAVLLLRMTFASQLSVADRARWLSVCTACLVVPVAPWLIAAYLETGYPLSPAPVEVFGIRLGVADALMTWYQDRPELKPFVWEHEKRALALMLSPIGTINESLGVLFCIPLLASLVGFVALVRRRPGAALLIAAAIVSCLLLHFSGSMLVLRMIWPISVSRYLIAMVALTVPLSLAWCRRDRPLALAYRLLLLAWPVYGAFYWVRWGSAPWEWRELMIWGVLITMLGATIAFSLKRSYRVGLLIFVLAWAWGCSALQVRRDQTRDKAYRESTSLHNIPRHWVDAVRFVEEPDVSHRIAVTGGAVKSSDTWFTYFFMGSRLQNELVYIPPTRDGKVGQFMPYGDLEGRVDRGRWMKTLKERGVTEVLTFTPASLEQAWMDADAGQFKKLAGGADWGLYRPVFR